MRMAERMPARAHDPRLAQHRRPMVWGIEKRISLPSGVSKPGQEASREYFRYLERVIGLPRAARADCFDPLSTHEHGARKLDSVHPGAH
jgi:hypothetical protein